MKFKINLKDIETLAVNISQDAYYIIQRILYGKKKTPLLKEHFLTIALNQARRILNVEVVSLGTNSRTYAEAQDVFRIPIQKAASQVILVHNHPSGTLAPSENDLDLTNKLIQAGLMFNIKVIDHLIVTRHSYYSFADNGKIEELRWDKKYALTFIREKQVAEEIAKIKKDAENHQEQIRKQGKQEGIKLGIQEGEKKGAKTREKEIARQMLKDGEELEKIKKYTGLTSQWLGRIKSEIEEKHRKQL